MILGLGGSATNDGGCGCAAALGIRFLDRDGVPFVPVGGTLDRLDRIDASGLDPAVRAADITVMCDIDNPLCGPNGASAVFGPQKARGRRWWPVWTGIWGIWRTSSAGIWAWRSGICPGSGAAGGMGGGMVAFLGGRLQMGIETVLDTVGFDAMVQGASGVLTGEGRIDGQSLRGKVVVGVARRAAAAGVPVIAVVGDVAPGAAAAYEQGVTAIFSTNRQAVPWEQAKHTAKEDLAAVMEDLSRLLAAMGQR